MENKKFNISNRIEMFAICTSLERDLKDFILAFDKTPLTESLIEKATTRKKQTKVADETEADIEYLDLGDFIEIIQSSPIKFDINNEESDLLREYFVKIIPVRNRVMHARPIEIGDRAILLEILETIKKKISFIKWNETDNVKGIIENGSSELLTKRYNKVFEYNPRVFHNLPEPEFDDTGYIGRRSDILKIKDLINSEGKHQIISLVGDGGIGKTAIAVKTLYDLIDDSSFDYDCILWISLKTTTLSDGEFKEIEGAIINLEDIYSELNTVTMNGKTNNKDKILEFMETFKTLLVVDNLETINIGEIKEFISEIPGKSKVLITSRVGLGEYEIRVPLTGLNQSDSMHYFRALSKYYGLNTYRKKEEDLKKLVSEDLYSNPLSIKWFINGLHLGITESEMLAQKQDLINYCISNVFEKLTEISKEILQIMLLEKQRITFGMLDYYTQYETILVKKSINELLATNMISTDIHGFYLINEMSREYISTNHPPTNVLMRKVSSSRMKLKSKIQEINIKREKNPFNPRAIQVDFSDFNQQIACHYLLEALDYSKNRLWKEALELCEKAKNIESDFFEIYKIQAFINAEQGEHYGAIRNYEIALSKAQTEYEKSIVCYLFSVFYVNKMQDYYEALVLIELAGEYRQNSYEILLEKSKINMYLGKFDLAEIIWHEANSMAIMDDLKTQNIVCSIYADLQKRIAETFQTRDFKVKHDYYFKAITMLNKVDVIDMKTAVILSGVLSGLSNQYFHAPSMELLYNSIVKHKKLIGKLKHKNKHYIYKNITTNKSDIKGITSEEILTMIDILEDFKSTAFTIKVENEGIVTKVSEYYGFLANNINPKGIYFYKADAYENIQEGDTVSFKLSNNSKGLIAKNIIFIS